MGVKGLVPSFFFDDEPCTKDGLPYNQIRPEMVYCVPMILLERGSHGI